jgi:hypothetical protein
MGNTPLSMLKVWYNLVHRNYLYLQSSWDYKYIYVGNW